MSKQYLTSAQQAQKEERQAILAYLEQWKDIADTRSTRTVLRMVIKAITAEEHLEWSPYNKREKTS